MEAVGVKDNNPVRIEETSSVLFSSEFSLLDEK